MKKPGLLLLPFLLFACNTGTEGEKETKTEKKNLNPKEELKLSSGSIYNDVSTGVGNETYDLYLPVGFSGDKQWPLVIAFDPQGNGAEPLRHYEALADEFGFVLAGSNYSKNGMNMETVKYHYYNMVDNISKRVNISKDRFYLIGFSGGAKVATYMGLDDKAVDGVVACGAGTKFQLPQRPFLYSGIAAHGDFNSPGMFYSYRVMEKMGLPYTFHFFDGKHEWPPKEDMAKAFRWFQLEAMKTNLLAKDESKISKWMHESEQELGKVNAQDNPLEFETAYKNMIKMYEGLVDVSSYKDAVQRMESSGRSAEAFKKFEASFGVEEAKKSQYTKALTGQDINWWKAEIKRLEKETNQKGEAKYQAQRNLGFLGLLAYMQASSALASNKLPEAEKIVNVYLTLEPENPEAHYLNAVLAAKKGNNNQVLPELKKAVELGFDDWDRLNGQVEFSGLKDKEEFKNLMK